MGARGARGQGSNSFLLPVVFLPLRASRSQTEMGSLCNLQHGRAPWGTSEGVMKAVRLTTAFAVAFGVVLPLPDARDLVPASWAAEKDAPPGSNDLRQRVEDLAKSASDRFGEIVGGKGEQPKVTPPAEGAGATVGLAEQIHSWAARSSSDYQELMRGLDESLGMT